MVNKIFLFNRAKPVWQQIAFLFPALMAFHTLRYQQAVHSEINIAHCVMMQIVARWESCTFMQKPLIRSIIAGVEPFFSFQLFNLLVWFLFFGRHICAVYVAFRFWTIFNQLHWKINLLLIRLACIKYGARWRSHRKKCLCIMFIDAFILKRDEVVWTRSLLVGTQRCNSRPTCSMAEDAFWPPVLAMGTYIPIHLVCCSVAVETTTRSQPSASESAVLFQGVAGRFLLGEHSWTLQVVVLWITCLDWTYGLNILSSSLDYT